MSGQTPLTMDRGSQGWPGPVPCRAAINALEAIVLGIIQGLTEFLPISSSGHLLIVPAFAGWEDPGAAFTAVIQLGTMAAVVVYFRRDLARIAVAFMRSIRGDRWRSADIDARMGWYIALGTIPISVAGLAFSNQIEEGARSLYLAGITLILFSFVMLAAERYGQRRASWKRSTSAMPWSSAASRRWPSCPAFRAPAPRSRPDCSSISNGHPPRATRSFSQYPPWCSRACMS